MAELDCCSCGCGGRQPELTLVNVAWTYADTLANPLQQL
jgi:hypothetical protein